MATLHDIVAAETEFTALLNDPRRPLTRFIEVTLQYGRMLAEQDPHGALDALALAIETLHDPPAPAEIDVALGLLRTMREVAADLGATEHELDAITREQHILDGGLAPPEPGEREALSRRAASVHFGAGDVEAGFGELIDGLRNCDVEALEGLASDMLLAIRRIPISESLVADVEALWVFLRRHRTGDVWELWCLVALGAVRLKVGDAITARMYLRRAETTLGGRKAPVVAALVNGWVALASNENSRARVSFTYVVRQHPADDRVRLLAAAGLGEALLALGRVDEAREPLTEAIGYDVGDPNTVARCHELLSRIAANDGRFRDAYEHLRSARLLERPAVTPEPSPLRRPTIIDLRDDTAEEPPPAEPPLRTVSAQIAEQSIVATFESRRPDDGIPHAGAPGREGTDLAEGVASEPEHAATLDAPPNGSLAAPVPDRLELVLSPIVENSSGRVGAVSASLRLVRSDGWVGDALPLSKDRGLRSRVIRHTLRRACHLLAARRDEPFAVLVDASHLRLDADLVAMVSAEVASFGFDRGRLIVAVPGAALVRTAEGPTRLEELRRLGIGIGIAGLGSTFTSTDVLLSNPVDVVLVSADVLGYAVVHDAQRRVLDAASSLARGFGFELVATGVANAEQFDLQLRFGCHGVIGPFVGGTVREVELADLLAVEGLSVR